MANVGARAAGSHGTTDARHDRGRTLAQWFCLIVGPVLILAGLFGFFADANFDTHATELQGDGFLGFEVNGIHNVVHIASGLFLLALAKRRKTARTAAIAFGAVYALVTLVGLIDGNDVFGLIPVNAADNVLHLVLSASALLAGFASPADDHVRDEGSNLDRAHPLVRGENARERTLDRPSSHR